jgi:protein DGCR14
MSNEATAGSPGHKVVDEDTFTAHIEKIIQRDFFPDLPKLSAQLDWIEAKKRNDFAKMNEIQMRFAKKRTASEIRATPNPYSTPDFARTPQLETNKRRRLDDSEDVASGQQDSANNDDNNNELPKNISLDRYLHSYKSEDDDSFDKVLAKNNKEHRQKYHWLFEKKELPKLAFDSPNDGQVYLTWNWTPKNSLMYSPDGVPAPLISSEPKKEISHTNTRIHVDEEEKRRLKEKQAREQAAQAAEMYSVIKDPQQIFEERRRRKDAKVDLDQLFSDGPNKLPVAESPRINGYGFVSTPQIAPDASPFITWGEIESTPLRLDDLETPLKATNGPQFKIPDMPSRDKITLDLANKAEAKMRAKQTPRRKSAPNALSGNKTPLSPAGQQLVEKLARRKTGAGLDADDQLRASYNTPSRMQSPRTPSLINSGTPSQSPAATPTFATPKAVTPSRSKLNATPKVTVREKQPVNNTNTSNAGGKSGDKGSMLPDNLLQL